MPFSIRPSRRFLPLVYSSGACALIILLLLSVGPAYAEWVEIEKKYQSPGLQTVHFDPDTIHREGHLATLWQLTDYKSVQGNVGLGRFALDPS